MSGASSTQGASNLQDGPVVKVTQCPAGHPLKRLNIGYVPGSCDGCNTRMKPKDSVMDCRECNWYLCQWCCPLHDHEESEKILTRLTRKAAQEVADLREATLAGCSCGAAARAKRASDGGEITVPAEAEASHGGAAAPGLRQEQLRSTRAATPAAAPAATPQEPAAEEEDEAEEEEAVPAAPPAPVEDLIDVGQHDLLDLDEEPTLGSKVEERGAAQQFDKLGQEEEDGLSKGFQAIQAGA